MLRYVSSSVIISAVVKQVEHFDLWASGFFQSGIHPLVFEVALEGQAIHVFVDKSGLELSYSDSSDSKDPSINGCDAYLRSVSILIPLNYGHHIMDFGIDRSMH